MEEAVARAHSFIERTPHGPKGEIHPKDYMAIQVELSPLGYMQKMEADVPCKCKPNEYRWKGAIREQ